MEKSAIQKLNKILPIKANKRVNPSYEAGFLAGQLRTIYRVKNVIAEYENEIKN